MKLCVLLAVPVPVLAMASSTCAPEREPSSNEVYAAVLDALSRELDLKAPIFLHPLPGRLDRERQGNEPMREFLELDTLVVPNVVKREPAVYRICRTTSTGSCVTPNARPWLILSEILELGDNAAVVVVLVRDPRSAGHALTGFRARVGFGWSGRLSVRLHRIR